MRNLYQLQLELLEEKNGDWMSDFLTTAQLNAAVISHIGPASPPLPQSQRVNTLSPAPNISIDQFCFPCNTIIVLLFFCVFL